MEYASKAVGTAGLSLGIIGTSLGALAGAGGLAGLLYRLLPKSKLNIYVTLVIAMIAGRIVWGIVRLILAGLSGGSFTWALFLSGAVTSAVPGIILHIVLIPVRVMALERAGLSLNK